MPKYRFTLNTGFAGCEHKDDYEVDDEDLEGLSDKERNKAIEEAWKEWVWGIIEGWWEEVEDD